jgi:homogentisate 1,2-dioxygenase
MLHVNNHIGLTQFALERNSSIKHIDGYEGSFWDDLEGEFLNHLDTVNEKLRAAGHPEIAAKQE